MNDRNPMLRLGSRGSELALAQSRLVAEALAAAHEIATDRIEIRTVKTLGDQVQDRPLVEIGGKALWTKELDRALLDDEIDIAVHSMKDVETILPADIELVAVLPREDARDYLIGAESIDALPQGAVVGTASPRRQAQIRNRRPDVQLTLLRGNVGTRLRRVADGDMDATFLAAAGLKRLGIDAGVPLLLDDWLPATAQGIIGMTCKTGNQRVKELLAPIIHQPTFRQLLAERAVLRGLGGNCHTAVAVHATGDAEIYLRAELLSPDGAASVRAEMRGTADPEALGANLARELLARATPAMRAGLQPGGL